MTRIAPGQFKGPEFAAGQRISVGDICRLQQMGRFHVAVVADEAATTALPGGEADEAAPVHENEVAEIFARRMALICIVLPAILSYVFCELERRLGWIKENDLKLQ